MLKTPKKILKYIFKTKIYIYSWELNAIVVLAVTVGLITGTYLTLTKLWPRSFATTQSTTTTNTSTQFSQGTTSSTTVSGSGSSAVVQLSGTAGPGNTAYKRAVTISNSGSALTDYQVVVDEGEVAYWKMDEASGTSIADSSGLSNTGTATGTTVTTGQYNNARSLNGSTTDYVSKSSFSNFPSSNITTAFWVKTSDSTDGLISYATSTYDDEWLLYDSSNLAIYRGASGNITTNVSINDNGWHFVVVTWKASNGETILYKDGTSVYSGTLASGTSITEGGTVVLGQDQDSVGGTFEAIQAFSGLVDEVRIYNRVLSSTEISSLYTNNRSPLLNTVYSSTQEAGGGFKV